MKRTVLALLLLLALLLQTPPLAATEPNDTQSGGQLTIAYIPLDNRPFNDSRVRLMAASMGYTLNMPPEDWYATKLDGQAPNANGTQYGDSQKLLQWLWEQEENGCDYYILSLDQLLSGGLMNSRCKYNIDLTEEYDILESLLALTEKSENQVYLIDSVLRLASSSGYGGYGSAEYAALRALGCISRPVLEDKTLTVNNILLNYPNARSADETGAFLPALDDPSISAAQREILRQDRDLDLEMTVETRHYAVRARKLQLSDYVLQLINNDENVSYLLGIDDSSNSQNIQTSELNYLSKRLDNNDLLTSSLDGLAQEALARLHYKLAGRQTAANIVYFGGSPKNCPSIYSYQTLEQMMTENMAYLGIEQTDKPAALQILVLSAPEAGQYVPQVLKELTDAINENEANGQATILISASDTGYALLHKMLVENTHLGTLLSFSANYEGPNFVTMALSQGVVRYRTLLAGTADETANQAHLINLTNALVKQFAYVENSKFQIARSLESQGYPSSNFFHAPADAVNQAALEIINTNAQDLYDNLAGSNYLTDLSGEAPVFQQIRSVQVVRCYFPWFRTFEVALEAEVETDPLPNDYFLHRSYISGVTPALFRPNLALTRAQAAKSLVCALGLQTKTPDTPSFTDVPKSDWSYPFVEAAVSAKLLLGTGGGRFEPNRAITRAELASVLHRYLQSCGEAPTPEQENPFTDIAPEKWYAQAVLSMCAGGYLNGYPDGTFLPDKPVIRSEAVCLINRVLLRKSHTQCILGALPFEDIPAGIWYADDVAAAIAPHWHYTSAPEEPEEPAEPGSPGGDTPEQTEPGYSSNPEEIRR